MFGIPGWNIPGAYDRYKTGRRSTARDRFSSHGMKRAGARRASRTRPPPCPAAGRTPGTPLRPRAGLRPRSPSDVRRKPSGARARAPWIQRPDRPRPDRRA